MKNFVYGLAAGLSVAVLLACAGAGASTPAPYGTWRLTYINYNNDFKLGEFDDATVTVYDNFVIIDRAPSDEADTIVPLHEINVMDIEYRK